MTVVAYDWSDWEGCLLPAILPEARRLCARPDDDPAPIVSSLPPDCAALAFHLDWADGAAFQTLRTQLRAACSERGMLALNAHAAEFTQPGLQAAGAFLGLASAERAVDLSAQPAFRISFAGNRYLIAAPKAGVWLSDASEFVQAGLAELPSALQLAVPRILAHFRLDFGALEIALDADGCVHPTRLETTPRWSGSEREREHLRRGMLERIADPRLLARGSATAALVLDEHVRAVLAREERLPPQPRPSGFGNGVLFYVIRLTRHHLIRMVREVLCRGALYLTLLAKKL